MKNVKMWKNQRLRILFVLGFPNPFPGAAWTRVGFFATHWSRRGHLIEVLGAFGYRSLRKRGVRKVENVNIFNIIPNVGVISPLAFVLNTLISFLVSVIFLLVRKPNIIIISVPPGDVGIGAIMACKLLRAKYIIDYRDEWEDYMVSITNSRSKKSFYSILKKFLTSMYARSHLIITVTPDFACSLKRRGLMNVRLIPNGADTKVFKKYDKILIRKKLGFNDDDFIIVYNGLIGWYYRLDTIIKALTKLSQKIENIKFLIIGEGPDIPRILALSNSLNICEKVLYLGVKNDKKEIAEILSACDVGIIPGLYSKGQLPVKFFEYSACELPTIATIYPDSLLARLIEMYELGIVVPPMDENKLTEAIYYIYKDKYFRMVAGRRARLFVEKRFDRNKIADDFLKLIENMLYGNHIMQL